MSELWPARHRVGGTRGDAARRRARTGWRWPNGWARPHVPDWNLRPSSGAVARSIGERAVRVSGPVGRVVCAFGQRRRMRVRATPHSSRELPDRTRSARSCHRRGMYALPRGRGRASRWASPIVAASFASCSEHARSAQASTPRSTTQHDRRRASDRSSTRSSPPIVSARRSGPRSRGLPPRSARRCDDLPKPMPAASRCGSSSPSSSSCCPRSCCSRWFRVSRPGSPRL